MSNKRNTRAGTSRAETSTALPTVPVPKKKRKPVPQELPQEPTQVSQVPKSPRSLRSLRSPKSPRSLRFPRFPRFPKKL